MISKGAKSLVVSSRKLDIAPELVEAHKLRGVQVCNLPGKSCMSFLCVMS